MRPSTARTPRAKSNLYVLAAFLLASLFGTDRNLVGQSNQNAGIERSFLDIQSSLQGGFLFDSDGFAWIGTMGSGVYRYDGYELKSHLQELRGLMVVSIVEDHDGLIWMATSSFGIFSYDKTTGEVDHFKNLGRDVNGSGTVTIPFQPQTLCIDSQNRIWVATVGDGLSRYDKSTDTWTRYRHDPNEPNSISNDIVLCVMESRDGSIWAGTQEGGLNRLSPETNRWIQYTRDPNDPSSISDNWICSILEDREGTLWVGTKAGGLNRMDRESGAFERFLHDASNNASIGGNEVWSLMEDSEGRLWVCHMVGADSGLDRVMKGSMRFRRFTHFRRNSNSLSSNAVTNIVENPRTGKLWILNDNGRIDRIDFNRKFQTIDSEGAANRSLSDNSVVPIIEAADGNIWAGTKSGGLNRINKANGIVSSFTHDASNPLSLPRNRITALLEDSEERLWVGLWDGILAEFDQETGLCERIFHPDPFNEHALPASERIKFILEDKDTPPYTVAGHSQRGASETRQENAAILEIRGRRQYGKSTERKRNDPFTLRRWQRQFVDTDLRKRPLCLR